MKKKSNIKRNLPGQPQWMPEDEWQQKETAKRAKRRLRAIKENPLEDEEYAVYIGQLRGRQVDDLGTND